MYRLWVKLFAIMLAVNVLLAGGLYLFLKTSFERSFSGYVSQRQKDMAETLATQLETYFTTVGNWQEFKNDPPRWVEFQRSHGLFRRNGDPPPFIMSLKRTVPGTSRGGAPPPPQDVWVGETGTTGPMPPPEAGVRPDGPIIHGEVHSTFFRTPFFLLDGKRKLIAGITWPLDQSYLRPLRVNDATIGFLGLPNSPELREVVDIRFAQNQSKNLAVIVIATLLLALLAAVPLSQLMTKRITALVGHVRKLSMGRYDEPLHMRGHDELNVLAEHLTDLGITLNKSEQQRNRWVADISHELRTPVAILQADIEAIEDGVRDLDQRAIGRLHDHVVRLKNLINDLHDLSLSDMGSLTYRKAACNLATIIDETVELLRPQLEQHGLTLEYTSVADDNINVLGDHQRLSQLFLNLLHNSLNYTDTPGTIRVSVERHDDNVIVQIDDSAPGVSKALQQRLTERLFRVENSRNRSTGGAGLGLAICANIVAAHSGQLQFDDSDLGGLRVTVQLPTAKV